MEHSEIVQLLTPEGLRLLDELPRYTATVDALRMLDKLRAEGASPALSSAVLTQAKLRTEAEKKFGEFARGMLFTRSGLEQATRLSVAGARGRRIREARARVVADLTCGIGADSLGLASFDLEVRASDIDEVTAAIATYNLAPFKNATVSVSAAENAPLTGVDAVVIDPARRSSGHTGHSNLAPDSYTPSLDFTLDLARRVSTCVKLGPAFERSEIPDDMEAQWVSVDGSVVEMNLWSGALRRAGISRSALLFTRGGSMELTGEADSRDEPTREIDEFIHEPDGAVIRAHLIGDVARALDAGPVAPSIAYLTGPTPSGTPAAVSFRVLEYLPVDVAAIRTALRARGVGSLEVKKRGIDINPAQFRKALKLKGKNAATLILTRVGESRRALICERVSTQ